MKTLLVNLSGNVGKTTLAKHLVAGFAPGVRVLSVESINADTSGGKAVEEIAASRFREIYTALMSTESIVVDVGASNIEQFMDEVSRFRSTLPEFDLFLVPVIPTEKQQSDTITTIEWLKSMGVPVAKIRVIFNRYEARAGTSVESVYPLLVAWLRANSGIRWEPPLIVERNDIYEMLDALSVSIEGLAADKTDFKAERARASGNAQLLGQLIDRQMAVDLATSAISNLRAVHQALNPPGAVAQTPRSKAA